jgi:hypothetical protein
MLHLLRHSIKWCIWDDMIRGMALGMNDEVYLVGHTSSPDFPVTAGAAQTTFGGGSGDAYVVKLAPGR